MPSPSRSRSRSRSRSSSRSPRPIRSRSKSPGPKNHTYGTTYAEYRYTSDALADPYVKAGDTLTADSDNQEGHTKYLVYRDKQGRKQIKLIDSYDMWSTGGKKQTRRARRTRRTRRKH